MIDIVSTEPATSDNDTIIPLQSNGKFAMWIADFFVSRLSPFQGGEYFASSV